MVIHDVYNFKLLKESLNGPVDEVWPDKPFIKSVWVLEVKIGEKVLILSYRIVFLIHLYWYSLNNN